MSVSWDDGTIVDMRSREYKKEYDESGRKKGKKLKLSIINSDGVYRYKSNGEYFIRYLHRGKILCSDGFEKLNYDSIEEMEEMEELWDI